MPDRAEKKSTHVCFRCSVCGCIINCDIKDYMIKNTSFTMKCTECLKTEATVAMPPDGKIHIVAPCLICSHPHPFTVSEDMFFHKDLLKLSCTYSGLDIFYIGQDETAIEDAVDETESLILDLTADSKDSEEDMKKADMMTYDTNVVREVLFALDNLSCDGKIHCGKCHSKAFKVVINYDEIILTCKVCGRSAALPARNRIDAGYAIDLDEFII